MYYKITFNDSLYHHGIKGQRWGVRRFRKKDGSLTEEGKKRQKEQNNKKKMSTKKKVAIGAGVVAAGLAVYGGYKYSKFTKEKAADERIKEGISRAKWKFAGAADLRNSAKSNREMNSVIKTIAQKQWDEERKRYSDILDLPKADPGASALNNIYKRAAEMQNHMADNEHRRGLQDMREAYNDADKFRKSFREAYKYLHKK